ncbi:MAG: spore coat protein [Eubacteriales bacterium]
MKDQESLCVQKYTKYENSAKDPELKSLFCTLKTAEEQHLTALNNLLCGNLDSCCCQSQDASNYNPQATYTGSFNVCDKQNDEFLCTDAITTEKYVSSAYNFDLFQFGNTKIRKLLNDIQTEEQNHAEKLFIYKTINLMT